MLKIATWNVNSVRMRLEQVLKFLEKHEPNVLALQETKVTDDKFPTMEIEAMGYQVVFSGQKSFNGVAMLSKQKAENIETDFYDFEDIQRRVLCATYGDVRVLNIYVPNGTELGCDKYDYKMRWLKKLKEFMHEQLKTHKKLVILGDFNIAPADIDTYDPKVWQNRILVSDPEREALRGILAEGMHDAFRLIDSESGGFSWFDYRHNAYMRHMGLRLDLILVSDILKKQCQSCYVDLHPREQEKPSDHAPVIVELAV